jgi:hypothetical protein
MTEKYGSKEHTCVKRFETQINIKNYSENKQKEIREIFIKFYNYLTKTTNILHKESSLIIDHFLNKEKDFEIILKDGSRANMVYYKVISKQLEINMFGKRKTFQIVFLHSDKDEIKFKNAIRANFIHAVDASLVR